MNTADETSDSYVGWSAGAVARLCWAGLSLFVVESLVFGLAVLPAALFFRWHLTWNLTVPWIQILVLGMAAIPTYFIFACALMVLSAWATRLLGWRTPERAELSISAMEWPLLNWIRYSIATQIVRLFAGTFLRSTPVWTAFMRLNGAKLGRRVFVNSLNVMDHCLLDFGDDVVIGADVHLSGHTVERGLVKTASVRLGAGVTVGVDANVEIGVEVGAGTQIGALSAVPKFAKLDAHSTYVGIPARKLEKKKVGE